MDCTQTREHLADRIRGRLAPSVGEPSVGEEVEAHLAGCDGCRREEAAERALAAALERLPRPDAPAGLRQSLRARWSPVAPPPPRSQSGRLAALVTTVLVAAALAWLMLGRTPVRTDAMVAEAVNDHLRVLYSERPLEIESGGPHQVKPWFSGRVDFAPVIAFAGDEDFPLQGGAVAYFIDRKAATYVFKRRLHVITLFIFRADGLPWQAAGLRPLGRARARVETSRGFHTILWRDGDLGYALVSDVDEGELVLLGGKIAGGS